MKTSIADFKTRLKRVRRSANNGHVDRALRELKRMLTTWPEHPTLLLEYGLLLQLSEHGSLSDAKRALQRAVKVDADSPDALTELGFYLLNVEDRAEQAEPIFDQAIDLALGSLVDALRGKIEAVGERPPNRATLTELASLLTIVLHWQTTLELTNRRSRLIEYLNKSFRTRTANS